MKVKHCDYTTDVDGRHCLPQSLRANGVQEGSQVLPRLVSKFSRSVQSSELNAWRMVSDALLSNHGFHQTAGIFCPCTA